MDNDELIKQARELCKEATPGPWKIAGTQNHIVCFGDNVIAEYWCPNHKDNAAFTAKSRTLVPQLCDALEAAQKENERLSGLVDQSCSVWEIREKRLTVRAEKAEKERDTYKAEVEKAEARYPTLPPEFYVHQLEKQLSTVIKERDAYKEELSDYEDIAMQPEEIIGALGTAENLISQMRNNKKAALWLRKYGKGESNG